MGRYSILYGRTISGGLLILWFPLFLFAQFDRVGNKSISLYESLGEPPEEDYEFVDRFPGLNFSFPIALRTPPGETNRLFVVSPVGQVFVIPDLQHPEKETFIDISASVQRGGESGLLGLAFHPQYATNGYFYLYYTGISTNAGERLDRLSRFRVLPVDPHRGDPASELILINQADEDQNHNAGDLHFGPDGYLYVSLGDEGGPHNSFGNAQRIDKDFFSGILRIDVDKKAGNLEPNPHPASSSNYLVPHDNPFIGVTNFNDGVVSPDNVRTEFWAVGLRNPWRMAFDPVSGMLLCGDVGQNAYEEFDHIVRGGNYGWEYKEASATRSAWLGLLPAAFEHEEPILYYGHNDPAFPGVADAAIGGVFYHGSLLPELSGHYVCGDYYGQVIAMDYDGVTLHEVKQLVNAPFLVAYGVDPTSGELLAGDTVNSQIVTLRRTFEPPPLPKTLLSETGLFDDIATLDPADGVYPFKVSHPFWSDGAIKTRYLAMRQDVLPIGFDHFKPWVLPVDTILIQHFELPVIEGDPASAMRIETRVIHFTNETMHAWTYKWDSAETNATLVPVEGEDRDVVISTGMGSRVQTWRYPSRLECYACHDVTRGGALAMNTLQINCMMESGTNQLAALASAHYFDQPIQEPRTYFRLARPDEEQISLTYRARSYLHANCAFCHYNGSAIGSWDASISNTLDRAQIVNGDLRDALGNPENVVLKPGNLTNSALHARMITRDDIRMPPVGSNELDERGIALMTEWINSLTNWVSYAEWRANWFTPGDPEGDEHSNPDGDALNNRLEWLFGESPTAVSLVDKLDVIPEANGRYRLNFLRHAGIGHQLERTVDLPEVDWQTILNLQNDPLPLSSNRLESIILDVLPGVDTEFFRLLYIEP